MILLGLSGGASGASIQGTARLEGLSGKRPLAQRALIKLKGNASLGPYSFFAEGFGEAESLQTEVDRRRLQQGVFLQEAYLEFKLDSFFLRAGKQALRWSEMWVIPSLDVWTGRRWNRFLFDPLSEQFNHSGGVSASWAPGVTSVEVAIMPEPGRSSLPQPLPEYLEEKSDQVSGGLRLKTEFWGLGWSAVAAQVGKKDTGGFSVNSAFEDWVFKFEAGQTRDRSTTVVPGREIDHFLALGGDFFLGAWTLQPQLTLFDFGDLAKNTRDYQSLYYLGVTWTESQHDVQLQTFANTSSKDFFFGLTYAYNWKNWMQIAVILQNYSSRTGALLKTYQDATGGWVGGLRLEFNGGWGD